jgi:D-3-phosphoglycerate dehydrogenase
MKKVLIAAPVHQVLIDGLEAAGYVCVIHEKIDQQSAFALIKDCFGVITSTRLQLSKELIDAAPNLQWIGRMGSGMEVIDVDYAVSKGIKCVSSPEGNRNAVAEHALGMLLSLTKRITWSHDEVKHGKWLRDENRGVELEGKTIGIIGFGNTGSAFARKLAGFDVKIIAYDNCDGMEIPEPIVNCNNLEPIFEEADIVSFHVPLLAETKHYFNDHFITKMKKPFILLNTSRGKIVDTKALWNGLQSKKIVGACLDVWEEEPIDRMSSEMKTLLNEMISLPQIIITPHIAGYSIEALFKMSKVLLDKIVITG